MRDNGIEIYSMRSIHIRDVPEDIYRKLTEQAAQEGKTLSEFALDVLTRAVQRPTRQSVLDRLATIPPRSYGGESAAESVRTERDAE